MITTALILWAAYLVVGFGLRALFQLVRFGSSGFVAPGALSSFAERLVAGLLVSALIAGAAGPVLALIWPAVASWKPWPSSRGLQLAGLAVYACGLAFMFVAQLAMGASWRVGVDASERTQLVEHGPFRRIRNPIFTGMIITGAGLVLVLPSWLALAAFAVVVVALHLQVRWVEEPHLLRVHGRPYVEYFSRTGRFFPRLRHA